MGFLLHEKNHSPIENNLPRNGFDLSQKDVFSMPVGLLTPCFVREVNPHDHLKIDVQTFMRARPLNSAAFARMNIMYDFYFVPYKVLWSYWDTFITQMPLRNTVNSQLLFSRLSSTNNPSIVHTVNQIPSIPLNLLANGSTALGNDYANLTDVFGVSLKKNYLRILDMLGYLDYNQAINTDYYQSATEAVNDTKSVNPFRLLAWNKILSDNYREENYENPVPGSWNIDDVTTLSSPILRNVRMTPIVQGAVKFAKWKRDYYTDVYPSPLYTDISQQMKTYIGSAGLGNTAGTEVNTALSLDVANNGSGQYTGTAFLGTASLRNMFAMEKLLEVTRRAGKNYDDQIAAHYGFRAKRDGRQDRSIFIGGAQGRLDINEVVSTADTVSGTTDNAQGAQLGKIAGKGYATVNGREITFDAQEFGVVIGVCYILPEAEYTNTGINPFNLKLEPADYFIPESQNLGYQPIERQDLYQDLQWLPADSNLNNEILAWRTRYAEYKTAVDRVHFGFGKGLNDTLGTYVAPRDFGSTSVAGQTPVYGPWSFHVNPRIVNSIFVTQYSDGDPDTDCFDVNQYIKCIAVRDMSISGLPY